MKLSILAHVLLPLILLGCNSDSTTSARKEEKVGLMIIDAQKWFIAGHPESLYELWGINSSKKISHQVIPAMDSVLKWANHKGFPVFVTYEGADTGRYDLPDELLDDLDSSQTTHYVKFFYGAPKHKGFDELLQNSGINQWIVIGAETDVCVYQTVKELLKQNKGVTLINEAIYSGRNNTMISRQNMTSFGAHFISLEELYTSENLFKNTQEQVETTIHYENSILTIVPSTDSAVSQNGDLERLKYLKEYAKIIGLPIEHPDSISTTNKVRLLAGDLNQAAYDKIRSRTADKLMVISDCTPELSDTDIPHKWHVLTLKMVFYELMETASFYANPLEDLEGWQKELKKAMLEERLGYVESLQNE